MRILIHAARIFVVALLLALLTATVFPVGIALADDPDPSTTETAVTGEPPEGGEEGGEQSVAEEVSALEQTDSVLVNAEGQAEPLATETAAQALSGGDPYIVRGGTTYRFFAPGGCAAYPGELGITCFESATPVQAAIDFALAGETIFVQAGTYVEQLFITKSITLQGEPGAKIQSPATVNLCYTTGTNPNEPIICVKDTDNVSILGLEVDGAGQGNGDYRFEGIGFFNAGGRIAGNVIHAIRENPLSGTQHGVGIFAYNLDGTPRTLVVEDNNIYDFQKNGITLLGAGLTAQVLNNTVTGSGPLGPGLPAQNGIQLGYGATGVISGNAVSNIWYTDPSWASVGILLVNAVGDVEISNNSVTDTKDAIYAYNSSGAVDADITGNLVLNCEWGVVIFSDDGTMTSAEIQGNDIQGCTVVGVYTDNPATTVNGNNIVGNAIGVWYDDYFGQGGQVDATGNYWGCPNGPDDPACDPVEGNVLYDPFATEPIVPPPAPGEGTPAPAPAAPAQDYLLIRARSGEGYSLSCSYYLTILQLPNGDRVLFYDLCSYGGMLTSRTVTELPAALPEGATFASAMEVALSRNSQGFEILPNGVDMTISFVIPYELAGKTFSVLYWDPKANDNRGGWIELPNKPSKLHPDQPDDLRRLTVGVHSSNGRVKATLNFTGLFVLLAR